MSTDEVAHDTASRIYTDLATVMKEHGIDTDECLLDCLTAAAMHHVEQLLTKVEWDT